MKNTQRIIAVLITTSLVFSNTVLFLNAANTSNSTYTFDQAVEVSKKVDARNTQIEGLINTFMTGVDLYTKKIKGNRDVQLKFLSKLKVTDKKLDVILQKLALPQYKNNIYLGIYKKQFNSFKVQLTNYIKQLESDTTQIINTGSTTTTTIKVGGTPEEKKVIAQNTVNEIMNDKDVTGDEYVRREETLKQNGYTPLEAEVLNMQNWQGDGFEFCANFTADIYTNNGWRYYEYAQSEVATEYKDFIDTTFPNRWKEGNKQEKSNIGRVQKCTAQLTGLYLSKGVDQNFVKALYEKAFGKTFKVWEKPLYKDGTSTNDYEAHITNIEAYIKKHHGW